MFGLHLRREDWRTRTGMLDFISKNWEFLSGVISSPTNTMGWYAANFEFIEKILSCRKFAIFLNSVWGEYNEFLCNHDTIRFMHSNMQEITSKLTSKAENDNFTFNNCEVGRKIAELINKYKASLACKRPDTPIDYSPIIPQSQQQILLPPPLEESHPIDQEATVVDSTNSANFTTSVNSFEEFEDCSFETFEYCEELIF